MKKVEVFDDAAEFLRAAAGKPRKARQKRASAQNIPRAPRGEGDRLAAIGRLAARGYMPRWRFGAGFDFWTVDGRFTSAHESYSAAVEAAERETKV